jgi:hypothetical protein
MLIDMNESYQRDAKTFLKVTKWNSNHMHLACILATSQAMQMKMELIRIQAIYHEDSIHMV